MEDGEVRLACVHLWDVGHIVDWQIPLTSLKAKRGGSIEARLSIGGSVRY